MPFRFVDGLHVDVDYVESTGNAAHYGISIAACTDFYARSRRANTGRDGIHIMGPVRNGRVGDMAGYTADDSVSITACDYIGGLTDVAGDVIGVTIGNIDTTTVQFQLKVMAGMNCWVDGIRVGGVIMGTSQSSSPVFIGEDTGNVGTVGGTWGTIDFGHAQAVPATTSKP